MPPGSRYDDATRQALYASPPTSRVSSPTVSVSGRVRSLVYGYRQVIGVRFGRIDRRLRVRATRPPCPVDGMAWGGQIADTGGEKPSP